jgi:hypothetical protein
MRSGQKEQMCADAQSMGMVRCTRMIVVVIMMVIVVAMHVDVLNLGGRCPRRAMIAVQFAAGKLLQNKADQRDERNPEPHEAPLEQLSSLSSPGEERQEVNRPNSRCVKVLQSGGQDETFADAVELRDRLRENVQIEPDSPVPSPPSSGLRVR